MKTITVSLPDRLVTHLEERVAAGEFESLDEALAYAVGDGLSTLESPTASDEADVALHAKIEASIEQYAEGRFVDGEDFMDRMERKFDGIAAGTIKTQ